MKQYIKIDELEELLMFSKDKNGLLDERKLLHNLNCNIKPIIEDVVNEAINEYKIDFLERFDQFKQEFDE